jgi:hypothetical protein
VHPTVAISLLGPSLSLSQSLNILLGYDMRVLLIASTERARAIVGLLSTHRTPLPLPTLDVSFSLFSLDDHVAFLYTGTA